MENRVCRFVLLLSLSLIQACTSVSVNPVSRDEKISHVCIEENPKVVADDFLVGVRSIFGELGVSADVYAGSAPASCTYVMSYLAVYAWDLGRYLSHAELNIYKLDKLVGSATYHLIAEGGFSLSKHNSLDEKMRPVLRRLLSIN